MAVTHTVVNFDDLEKATRLYEVLQQEDWDVILISKSDTNIDVSTNASAKRVNQFRIYLGI